MRVRYLLIALLAGILAAIDSTRPNLKSATFREEVSPPSDGDDVAAIGTSVGHEDRARPVENEMTISRFVEDVLLSDAKSRRRAVEGFSKQYAAMIENQVSPQKVYREIVGDFKGKTLLITQPWRKWAFLASKYCAKEGKDPHEYITKVMLNQYGDLKFIKILAAAADKPSTKKLVVKLREAQISVWLKKKYQPEYVYDLLQPQYLWKKDIFDSPWFAAWTLYMKRLHKAANANDLVVKEVRSLCDLIGYERLIKMLTLPKNASHPRGEQYLRVLMSIMVDEVVAPSNVVTMLRKGVRKGNDQFTLLLIDEPASTFWMTYYKKFNKRYSLHNGYLFKTLTSVFKLPDLLTMLHVALESSDDHRSSMALVYLEKQFLEWKTAKVKKVTDMKPSLTDLPLENRPTAKAIWLAYTKYCEHNTRPSKADFLM